MQLKLMYVCKQKITISKHTVQLKCIFTLVCTQITCHQRYTLVYCSGNPQVIHLLSVILQRYYVLVKCASRMQTFLQVHYWRFSYVGALIGAYSLYNYYWIYIRTYARNFLFKLKKDSPQPQYVHHSTPQYVGGKSYYYLIICCIM